MCLARPVSNNFICFTVNGLQVLCLTDCGPFLPACGLDNCDWWVFSTSKVSVVWAFWLCGASNPMETVATTRLLEKGHTGKVADVGSFAGIHINMHMFIYNTSTLTHIHPSGVWAVIIRIMICLSAFSSCHYCVAAIIHKITQSVWDLFKHNMPTAHLTNFRYQKTAALVLAVAFLPSEMFFNKTWPWPLNVLWSTATERQIFLWE